MSQGSEDAARAGPGLDTVIAASAATASASTAPACMSVLPSARRADRGRDQNIIEATFLLRGEGDDDLRGARVRGHRAGRGAVAASGYRVDAGRQEDGELDEHRPARRGPGQG